MLDSNALLQGCRDLAASGIVLAFRDHLPQQVGVLLILPVRALMDAEVPHDREK